MALLFAAVLAAATTGVNAQTLVSWDLQEGSNTQSGFTPVTALTGTTTGDFSIDIVAAGGSSTVFQTFDRGWSNVDDSGIPNADLYRDYVTRRASEGFNVTISGAGIEASTAYQLRLFSYDWFAPSGFSAGNEVTMNYSGIDGTTGTGSVTYTLGSSSVTTSAIVGLPQSALEYSSLVDFTSNSSGQIVFNVASGTAGYDRVYLNGVEVIPEPTSFGLLAASLACMIAVSRRRRR